MCGGRWGGETKEGGHKKEAGTINRPQYTPSFDWGKRPANRGREELRAKGGAGKGMEKSWKHFKGQGDKRLRIGNTNIINQPNRGARKRGKNDPGQNS